MGLKLVILLAVALFEGLAMTLVSARLPEQSPAFLRPVLWSASAVTVVAVALVLFVVLD